MTAGVYFLLVCLGLLSGSDIVCSDEDAIYQCTRGDGTLINWMINSACGSLDYRTSFSSTSSVGELIVDTLCSATLTFAVTSLTSSSISVTLTIHTPVLLNRTRITCQGQTVILHVFSSKFLWYLK